VNTFVAKKNYFILATLANAKQLNTYIENCSAKSKKMLHKRTIGSLRECDPPSLSEDKLWILKGTFFRASLLLSDTLSPSSF
jgi:hypothetical protein